MSLNKAIKYGKEKRKEYTGAKAIDCTCRNHGSCEWCKRNRLYQQMREEEAAKQALEDILEKWGENRPIGEVKDVTTTTPGLFEGLFKFR